MVTTSAKQTELVWFRLSDRYILFWLALFHYRIYTCFCGCAGRVCRRWPSGRRGSIQPWLPVSILEYQAYTDKKENQISYYIRKCANISPYMRTRGGRWHRWLCNCSILNFLRYEENFIFFFISVQKTAETPIIPKGAVKSLKLMSFYEWTSCPLLNYYMNSERGLRSVKSKIKRVLNDLYRTGFPAVVWLGSRPLPPSCHAVGSTVDTQEDWERETTCGRKEGGRSQNARSRESLVLFKSFNTLYLSLWKD